MPDNKLIIINKSNNLVLNKARNLLNLQNKLLSQRDTCITNFDNYRFDTNFSDFHDVCSLAITLDGKIIVSSDFNTIKLWNTNSGECIQTFEGHNSTINSLALTLDGELIVSGDCNTIKLWDINSGKCIRTFDCSNSIISSLTITPNGKFIISSLAITPDGKFIAHGGDTIKLLDIHSGECIRTFKESCNSIAITPDGKFIVSGSYDAIKLWDINSDKEIATYIGLISGGFISYTACGYYNYSEDAQEYCNFYDGNKLLDKSHLIYKQNKKKKLLNIV